MRIRDLPSSENILFDAKSQRDLAKQERDGIVGRIRERLNASPDALRGLAELDADAAIECDEDGLNVLEQRYDRLIRERENIGPVNLRAEAEMEELEERITGINTEREDLNAAISECDLPLASSTARAVNAF